MRSHWQEPFLWIHAAGILLFPLWIGLTVIGLATGDPLLSVGVEQAAVAVAGIGPVFAMQWRKPFDVFSLWVAAVPPEELTPDQRRILAAFLSPEHKILTLLAALLLLEVFERLYDFAPLFAPPHPWQRHPSGRPGHSRLRVLGGQPVLADPPCCNTGTSPQRAGAGPTGSHPC